MISPLADHVAISPNRYDGRAYPITKITIHHMAGDLTVEECGGVFSSSSREASSNYGVGSDGRIGCYVDEDDAAWTSKSWDNDNRAVTIEVADHDLGSWSPSDAAYESTIDLCVDICHRNGIDELYYDGTPNGTMTEHLMFAATACPGPWWHERMAEVTEEINARLRGESKEDEVRPIYNDAGPMYRLYNPGAGLHHFTMDAGERDGLAKIGWNYEGVAFTVHGDGAHAVYRMYNPGNGDHLFTVSYSEAKQLEDAGWKFEFVPFFAQRGGKEGMTPVHRLYNPGNGKHFMTASDDERAQLVKAGWSSEGGFTV